MELNAAQHCHTINAQKENFAGVKESLSKTRLQLETDFL